MTRKILLFLAAVVFSGTQVFAADKIKLRLSASASASDLRAVAMNEKFGPAVSAIADFEGHYSSSLFKQGTELDAIARGNLEMSITSAQELSDFFPEFTIFTAGYMLRDADHQVAVFNSKLMEPFKEKVEEELGIKLLGVMYLGRRQVNLRLDKKINTPADLAGVKLRMPGSESWQFLGKALGANPVPMAYGEVYTGLQTGAIDGQDNPLPSVVDMKFFEVTKQIALTSHLVDQNYIAFSKKVWDKLSKKNQGIIQKAVDEATSYERTQQLAKEEKMVTFLKDQGLKIYTPDVASFRKRVQKMYLESDLAKSWPKGLVDKINAL